MEDLKNDGENLPPQDTKYETLSQLVLDKIKENGFVDKILLKISLQLTGEEKESV